ncbi:hypothetical protein HELRODRAFT_72348 [Helobdella robusta]|uniref:6-pyruvoyl tetrahydrobiopterin synthase n=1 Tax=Helobdella robusta TaxID=6412 RepID=T1G0Y7_HELRO|nr:hypothetical protein HELRODRAFT_72348 [Helobdella robusta]ESO10766.1 hypothetical protein HELRODRAFT_72348 [Helobdella robusta]
MSISGKLNDAKKNPVVYITRCATFSACHRLHSPKLSDEENRKIFGKCNHINGHGHNYRLEVTLKGEVEEDTGMVYNLSDLCKVIETCVIELMDHKNLDKDVEFFKNNTSTSENLCVFIWHKLLENLSKPHLLFEVKLHETDNNIVYYKGE